MSNTDFGNQPTNNPTRRKNMVNQFGDRPCILITKVTCGKMIDKSQSFRDRQTGERVNLDRRLLQASFTDATGELVFAGLIPVQNWSIDLTPFSRKVVDVLVCGMEDSKEGFTILRIMGIQEHEVSKRISSN